MVTDKTNKIFTDLIKHMKEVYPKISGGTTYNEVHPKFPYIYFFQIDAPTRLTTLSNTEDGVSLSYQIEVYSDSGTNKTREIANEVRRHMVSKGFICKNFMPVQTPSNISRFVGRYERLDV